MEEIAILGAAVAFDLLLGEYPARLHPVVWLGQITDRLLDFSPSTGAMRQFLYGLFVVVLVVAIFAVPAWLLLMSFRSGGGVVYVLAGALVLKPAFSLRVLWEAVQEVRRALTQGDIQEARQKVGQIVSRDVATLSPPLVAAAAIESSAENLTDSLVAPLFYFVLLGPAGALAYRVVNTLDAMIGYHGRYEYVGKAAARLDDVLNFVPARLAALLLAVSAGPAGGSVAGALRTMWRDHAKTESPNAGWTMSAMSGALGVKLEKPGAYQLGADHPEPGETHIRQALLILAAATTLALLLVVLTEATLYARSA